MYEEFVEGYGACRSIWKGIMAYRRGMRAGVSPINASLQAACPASSQFLFVTATLPAAVAAQVRAEFPDVLSISG